MSTTTLAPIYLGGISSDMPNLGVAANTAQLRALGAAFYVHTSWLVGGADIGPAQTSGCVNPASVATASATLKAITSTFAEAPPPMIELGMPQGFNAGDAVGLKQLIMCNCQSVGLRPNAALVNVWVQGTGAQAVKIDQPTTLAQWQLLVDTLRGMGVQIVMPIASPNIPGNNNPVWSAAEWEIAREMALYGGGLAFDAPPSEYLGWGATPADVYGQYHMDALAWATQQGIPTAMILSAYSMGLELNTFETDVFNWLKQVQSGGHTLTSLVYENYTIDAGSPGKGKTAPTLGVESKGPGLLSTALAWMQAQQPAPAAPAAPAVVTRPVVLYLTGDAYQGSPIVSVSVDGGAASLVTVTATRGSAPQAVPLDLPLGKHTIAVRLTNDLYGGSPAADRNAYLVGITSAGLMCAGAGSDFLALLGSNTRSVAITVV